MKQEGKKGTLKAIIIIIIIIRAIIYSLVARGSCVLAEFTRTSGNFATVTRRILEKIPPTESKMSYVYDRYVCMYVWR